MKTRLTVAVSMLAGAALGGAAMQALHAQAKPPVYMIALNEVRDVKQLESLREKFRRFHRNILRMAAREGLSLSIPSVLPNVDGPQDEGSTN